MYFSHQTQNYPILVGLQFALVTLWNTVQTSLVGKFHITFQSLVIMAKPVCLWLAWRATQPGHRRKCTMGDD
jgi:hypothetical protein